MGRGGVCEEGGDRPPHDAGAARGGEGHPPHGPPRALRVRADGGDADRGAWGDWGRVGRISPSNLQKTRGL